MRLLLYTTSKGSWTGERISKIQKRLGIQIDTKYVNVREVDVIVDQDGDCRFSWDWFDKRFPLLNYDGVGFHFTKYYKKKWLVSKRINGARNARNLIFPQFWLCADKNDLARGYEDLTEFERLFYHEFSHFEEDLDNLYGDNLDQDSVHKVDYELKQIHNYHLLVNRSHFSAQSKLDLLKEKIKSIYAEIKRIANL